MRAPGRRSQRPGWEAATAGLAFAALYLLTRSENHSEAEDGLDYALDIGAAGERLIDPYHLLYQPLGWVAQRAARGLGVGSDPLAVLQVANALIGAAGIALLWLVLRGAGLRRFGAAVACVTLGLSYGYWFYSGEAEVYVLAAALLILALAAAARAFIRPATGSFALLGAATGLAILGHATNGLFVAVALVALLAGRSAPGARPGRWAAAYLAAGAAVVVPAFVLAAGLAGIDGLREAQDWLARYPSNDQWGAFRLSTVPEALLGAGRALVGGHFVLSLGPVEDAARSLAGTRSIREELFMVRDFSPAVAALLTVLTVASAAALAGIVRRWRDARDAPGGRALVPLCVAWLASYAVFFAWWEPANPEFWIAPWIPAAVLIGAAADGAPARREGRSVRILALLAAGGLLAANLFGSILPQTRPRDDYWHVRADWYRDHAGPRDAVIAAGAIWSHYIEYESGARVVDAGPVLNRRPRDDPGAVAEIEQRAAGGGPRRVLISDEVFRPATDPYSRCAETGPLCVRARALRAYLQFRSDVLARRPLETVWRLDPPPP